MNDIRIIDFRVEDAGGADGSFTIWIRRETSMTAILTFPALLAFMALGVGFLGRFIYQMIFSPRPTNGKGGPPAFCCAPFLLVFLFFWTRPIVIMLIAHINRLRGREKWTFANLGVVPPRGYENQPNEAEPLTSTIGLRAGRLRINNKLAIAIGSTGRELFIGPFASEVLAQRFESELRARRADWFDAPQTEVPTFAVPLERSGDGSTRESKIEDFDVVVNEPDKLKVSIRRSRRERRFQGTPFLFFWLCFWVVGETLVGKLFVETIVQWIRTGALPASTKGGPPPIWFMLIWLPVWTCGGIFAIRSIVTILRHTETWTFTPDKIIAGRNAQYPQDVRTLRIHDRAHVQLSIDPSRIALLFIAEGLSLELGPFIDEDTARRFGDLLSAHSPAKWISHE